MRIPQCMSKAKYLVGDACNLEQATLQPVMEIFSGRIIDFLAALSELLLHDREAALYPDVLAFAFWIRRKNIQSIKENYTKETNNRIGRGIAFHIAPSNIPIQFAVMLISGLLSGNINIVRVSKKEFGEVKLICNRLNKLLKDSFEDIIPYILILQYGHDKEINEYLSSICDIRLIWGGNETVQSIRKIPIQPRSVEFCFADRDSILVIDSDKFMECNQRAVIADFYSDTYYVDQNACSSPRVVIWLGNHFQEAKSIFWQLLEEKLDQYELPTIAGGEKLLKFSLRAIKDETIRATVHSNKLVVVEVKELTTDLLEDKCGMGYFFEYHATKLEDMVPLLGKSCQTITFSGVDPSILKKLVIENGVRGVDRIVKIGQALGISLKWDGLDMIYSLSRIIV